MAHEQQRWGMIAGWAVFKGASIAGVTAAIGVEFWQAIAVALISGVLGAIGVAVSTYIAARYTKENRVILQDVQNRMPPPYPAPAPANGEENGG